MKNLLYSSDGQINIFPKQCLCCGKTYGSYANFSSSLVYIGREKYSIKKSKSVSIEYWNCHCGSTLVVPREK
jgi:hypothetical protein